MRYCPHCGFLTVAIKNICFWCGGVLSDNGQPDDGEIDQLDTGCGC